MKDNYSIDELVRQKLANGQEQHNLSAWANMERMLDGKNPYNKPEKDSKRRWLPFFLLFVVLGSGVAVALNSYTGSEQLPISNANTEQAASQAVASINNQDNTQAADVAAAISEPTQGSFQAQQTTQSNTNLPAPTAAKASVNNTIQEQNKQKAQQTNLNTKQVANNNSIIKNSSNAKQATNNNEPDNSNSTPIAAVASKLTSTKPTAQKSKEDILALSTKKETITPTAIANNAKMDTKQIDITALRVEEKIVTDANGNKSIAFDSTEFSVKMNVPIEKTNPRYVALSKKDQERAENKTGILSSALENLKGEEKIVASSTPLPQKTNAVVPEIKAKADVTNNTNEKISFYTRFKNMSKALYQKANTATIKIADKQIPIYPGMIVGVNASVFSKHNFGGFQGGLTALTPLNRYLSISTEARLLHKNNSGYTVNDYNYTIKNMSVDSNSLSSSKIYNYQVDSNALGYNFKNFYTIQMPILLNAHVRDFTFYGGLNMVYGFRMDVRTSNKDYVVNVADTIATNSVYNQRANIGKRYTRDDFNSRFGLGYTVGGSYSFNPNLYLDLRFSNVLWDNSKSATKQQISNDMFQIPAIQFSLGYRFRKFDRTE